MTDRRSAPLSKLALATLLVFPSISTVVEAQSDTAAHKRLPPAYSSQTTLPYGAGLPAPYSYGAGRPTTPRQTYNAPTTTPPGEGSATPGKTSPESTTQG